MSCWGKLKLVELAAREHTGTTNLYLSLNFTQNSLEYKPDEYSQRAG